AVRGGAAGDRGRVARTPAALRETGEIRRVALVRVEGELERLACAPRQLGELEERDPLGVLAQHGLAVFGDLEPIGRRPARDGRERLGVGIVCEGPEIET